MNFDSKVRCERYTKNVTQLATVRVGRFVGGRGTPNPYQGSRPPKPAVVATNIGVHHTSVARPGMCCMPGRNTHTLLHLLVNEPNSLKQRRDVTDLTVTYTLNSVALRNTERITICFRESVSHGTGGVHGVLRELSSDDGLWAS